LRVYWWNDQPNFGDRVTADIVESLFGYTVVWSEIDRCEVMGAGSILGWASGRGNCVWGSGFMFPDEPVNPELVYCAVRGELSRRRLGADYRGVPLGDPGLLANITYRVSGRKSDRVGVVPHFVDQDLPIVERMRRDARFLVMNVADPPEKIAEQISQCRLVLSSSLHGLIFSDSLGVPNLHIQLSNQVAGSGFKFRDYYSSVGKPHQLADAERLFDGSYHEEMVAQYRGVKDLARIQRHLLRAFPHH